MTEMPPPPPSPKSAGRKDGAQGPNLPGPAVFGHRKGRKDATGAWMVTFTDLVALLLTFFVMIFAMSTVKVADWKSLTESLRRQLSSVVGTEVARPSMRLDVPAPERTLGTDLDYLAELLQGQLAEAPPLDQARIRRDSDRVYVSLPSDLLFGSGAYTLTDAAETAVFEIGGVLRNLSNGVAVVGHADPRKPQARYPSNWELSLLRSRAVAAALRQAGVDGAIRARGYGDARYHELPADLPTEKRQALARRVDIVIHEVVREPIR